MPMRGGGAGLPFVGCRLWRDEDLNIANTTWTYIPFNTVHIDTDGMANLGANPTRISIRTAGVYQVGCVIQWETDGGGYRRATIRLNRLSYVDRDNRTPPPGVATVNHCINLYEFEVGDYIEVRVYQNSGAVIAQDGIVQYTPVFWAVRVGLPT